MSKGYVYVLSNPSMPGLVKIGHSKHGGAARARQIDGTGVPTPFVLEHETLCEDAAWVEKQSHLILESIGARVSHSREFFRCQVETATAAVLEAAIQTFGYEVILQEYRHACYAALSIASAQGKSADDWAVDYFNKRRGRVHAS